MSSCHLLYMNSVFLLTIFLIASTTTTMLSGTFKIYANNGLNTNSISASNFVSFVKNKQFESPQYMIEPLTGALVGSLNTKEKYCFNLQIGAYNTNACMATLDFESLNNTKKFFICPLKTMEDIVTYAADELPANMDVVCSQDKSRNSFTISFN